MQNNDIYGVVNREGVHIDISKTERGAKMYATQNGYTQISVRLNAGYNAPIIAEKVGNKWKPITA